MIISNALPGIKRFLTRAALRNQGSWSEYAVSPGLSSESKPRHQAKGGRTRRLTSSPSSHGFTENAAGTR